MSHRLLFDLDNVLHNALASIMPRMSQDMTAYLQNFLGLNLDEANALRIRLWRQYGATLTGLQQEHPGFSSADFLAKTHQFPDIAQLVAQSTKRRGRLRDVLRRQPRRAAIVTNAPREYALRVVKHLGIAPYVERVFAVEDSVFAGRWMPKPSKRWLLRVSARLRTLPSQWVHFEDTYTNLKPARALRMRTVYVSGYFRSSPRTKAHSKHLRAGNQRIAGHHLRSIEHLSRLKLRR